MNGRGFPHVSLLVFCLSDDGVWWLVLSVSYSVNEGEGVKIEVAVVLICDSEQLAEEGKETYGMAV